MLELSPAALAMIVRLCGQIGPDSELALRIAGGGTAPGRQMTLAGAPDPEDIVVIDPEATVLLDARTDDRGWPFFLSTRSR